MNVPLLHDNIAAEIDLAINEIGTEIKTIANELSK